MTEPYDWVDDDTMSTEETMRRFRALNPKPTTGPPPRTANFVVTFDAPTPEVVKKPTTSGSYDERCESAPDSIRQAFEPRQPVLVGGDLVPTS